MRRLALVLALALATPAVALSPPPAAAAPDAGARVRARLAQGRKHFDEQEYRQAVRDLAPVARDPAATRAQRLQALELLGIAWLILGDEGKAREAFEDLLAIDPGYQLRDAAGSPKIEQFFAEVKQAYVPDAASGVAQLDHAAPASATAGRTLELAADVTSAADQVKELVVLWRRRGELSYNVAPMRPQKGARWRAVFTPPADNTGYEMEYYLEARDLAGRVIGRVGGPETPLVIRMRGAAALVAARPWYTRWYVWAGGAVLVGTAVGVGLAVTADEAPEGTLGTEELP